MGFSLLVQPTPYFLTLEMGFEQFMIYLFPSDSGVDVLVSGFNIIPKYSSPFSHSKTQADLSSQVLSGVTTFNCCGCLFVCTTDLVFGTLAGMVLSGALCLDTTGALGLDTTDALGLEGTIVFG